jgi:uncharacterized protein (DUF1330 family)
MAAYMIAMIEIHDSSWMEEYRRDVPAMIARHGGEYVAIGQAPEVIEGVVPGMDAATVFRFPDLATIKAFLDSDEYRPFREMRMKASDARIIAFESEI